MNNQQENKHSTSNIRPTIDGLKVSNINNALGNESANLWQSHSASSIDMKSLRLSQDFSENTYVKQITRVPVRKPDKAEFFRIHPHEDYRIAVYVLELKQEREVYVLTHEVWSAISELARPMTIHTAIDRKNNIFLIPVPLPGNDGRRNSWHQSLAEIVTEAHKSWVRIVANPHVAGYDLLIAKAVLAEPEWPTESFESLFEIAFRGKVINSTDHPVIRRMLGVA